MLFNSKELWAERQKLADSIGGLVADGKVDEARIAEGQVKQLDITLEQVLADEAALRDSARIAEPAARATFGEQILGPRDAFDGIEFGFKAEAADPSVVHVPGPTEVELELPGKPADLLSNFAATLPSVPSSGSVSFKQRSRQIGGPDTWGGVADGKSAKKAKVIYTWKDAVANKEAIAGYVPVSKDTLKDYADLLSIIEGDLLIDLGEKENAKILNGSNSAGIVGVLNTPGIIEFDPAEFDLVAAVGGLYYEAIRCMRTEVMKTARRVPTHVALHPDIKTAIDLYKTSTGLYQVLSDGVIWGMVVVEDFECDGILVYAPACAKKRPVHNITVELGYVNEQFIENELSILAEKTTALQVVYPDAFCYASKAKLDAAAGKTS